MKLTKILAVLTVIASLAALSACSQATSDTGKTGGTTGPTTVGAVKKSVYDFSAAAGQAWTGGGTTFATDNLVPALKWTTTGWAPITGPTLSPVLNASTYTKFSIAVKGTWTGGSYMAIPQGFRVGLYDPAGVEADFDVNTATLSGTAFTAFSFDTASAGFQGHGATSAFDWTQIKRVEIYDMGGSGTLTITNLGFN